MTRPVEIDGVRYLSLTAAAAALGVSIQALSQRLKAIARRDAYLPAKRAEYQRKRPRYQAYFARRFAERQALRPPVDMSEAQRRAAKTKKATGKYRLTRADVTAIREAWDAGERQRAIAERYGVSVGTISHIVTRRTWDDQD